MPRTLIRTESSPRKSGGTRVMRVYLCTGCNQKEVKVVGKSEKLNEVIPQCYSCCQRKRPFESIYNGLFKDHRKTVVDLSYEGYLTFTYKPCHYCESPIDWQPYGVVRGTYTSRAYYLDRKDHKHSYSLDNCVTCCTRCNIMRSDKFTYEEFIEIGRSLSVVYKQRRDLQQLSIKV